MTPKSCSHVVARMVVALTLAGSVLAPAAKAGDLCADPHESEPTRTFDVRMSTRDVVHQIGDVVKFRVSVTRKVDGMVLGPVQGAEVTLAVAIEGRMVGARGVTDESGKAVLRVQLKSFMSEGSADVYGWAEKLIADVPCRSQYEYEFGSFMHTNFLEIAR